MKENAFEKIVLAIAVVLLVISCSNDITNDSNKDNSFRLRNTMSLETLNPTFKTITFLDKMKLHILASMPNEYKHLVENINMKSGSISEYENSDKRSFIIPIMENISFVTYITDSYEIAEGGYLIEITKSGDIDLVRYLGLNLVELARCKVKDGNIFDVYTKPSSYITEGWWGSWGDCIASGLKRMTSGEPLDSAIGLLCIAFGPECAAGAAIGCAIAVSL